MSGSSRVTQVPPDTPDRADRPDASMTLLTQILERPLDPGYTAMARRREAQGLPASTGGGSWRFAVALALAGLLLGVSAVSLRDTATGRANARAELIAQIGAGRKDAESKAGQITALNAELAALDARALAGQPGVSARTLSDLGLATGAAPVAGPAMVLTIDDAPDAGAAATNGDPRAPGRNQDGIVRARDLQIIANSLWAAGAEAMAINGQRLTSTTAIRFAGEALIVNYRPLTRPYVITAIGDPSTMPASFAQGTGGTYVATLTTTFGISVHTSTRAEVTLPASSSATTRLAQPLTPTPAASTTSGTTPQSTPSPSGGPS